MKKLIFVLVICAVVAVLFLSFNIAHAVSCNPKARVHQQRLANIQTAVSFGQIPSADDEQFVLCMLPEKEDQQAFRRQVQQLRDQLRARQQQEAEQRRQAIIAHNRPQSPEEQASAQAQCVQLVRESGELRDAGVAYCLAAWKANPHSTCGGPNLPCGSADERLCYTPYAGQRCINGQVTDGGAFNFAPWVENAPVQITKLADGVYTDEGIPCGRPGQRGVILIHGDTAQLWGRNTYRLVNTKQAGVLDALNNGTGDQGYNGQIIVSGSTFRWSGYGVQAQRPFRLCQEVENTSNLPEGEKGRRDIAVTAITPTIDEFIGRWENKVQKQNGAISRIKIENQSGKISAHIWGSCSPRDCDRGTADSLEYNKDGTLLITKKFINPKTNESVVITYKLIKFLYGNAKVIEHVHSISNPDHKDIDRTHNFIKE